MEDSTGVAGFSCPGFRRPGSRDGQTVPVRGIRAFRAPRHRHPAPVLPTQHLVVTGLYRYVRNPMCSRRSRNSRSKYDPRKPGPCAIRRPRLACLSAVCCALRRAGSTKEIRGRVRRVQCQCASMDTPSPTVGRTCGTRPIGELPRDAECAHRTV
jgi:hypothetical protein